MRSLYQSRRDVLVEGLSAAGWEIPSPKATMFAWAPIPESYQEVGSLEFSKMLLREAKVAVSPGIGFGEYGEGFVRIALVENLHRTRQAIRNINALRGGMPRADGGAMIRPWRNERHNKIGRCRPGTVGVGAIELLDKQTALLMGRSGKRIEMVAVSTH